jgi:quinol monooxygenase YgiN
MIVITAKFRIKPEFVDTWPEISSAFTTATRAEAGCLWFDWSRSLDHTDTYVLIEAFRDDDAGAAHVQSDHFKAATNDLPPYLVSTPLIINTTAPGESWSELGELTVTE